MKIYSLESFGLLASVFLLQSLEAGFVGIDKPTIPRRNDLDDRTTITRLNEDAGEPRSDQDNDRGQVVARDTSLDARKVSSGCASCHFKTSDPNLDPNASIENHRYHFIYNRFQWDKCSPLERSRTSFWETGLVREYIGDEGNLSLFQVLQSSLPSRSPPLLYNL